MEKHQAQQFAQEWVSAWNAHDLDKILSHQYSHISSEYHIFWHTCLPYVHFYAVQTSFEAYTMIDLHKHMVYHQYNLGFSL